MKNPLEHRILHSTGRLIDAGIFNLFSHLALAVPPSLGFSLDRRLTASCNSERHSQFQLIIFVLVNQGIDTIEL